MDCSVKNPNEVDPRLQELVEELGHFHGLKKFLSEKVMGTKPSFDTMPYDNLIGGKIKVKYEYYKSSADAVALSYADVVGKENVQIVESVDGKGRPMYRVMAIRPTSETKEDFSIGIEDNAFDKFESYLKGQRRFKYNRLTKLLSDSIDLERQGNLEKLEENNKIITSIREDIDQLEQTLQSYSDNMNTANIKSLANTQLNWLSSVLSKPEISFSELREINYVIELWDNLEDKIYSPDDVVPQDMKDLFSYIDERINNEQFKSIYWKVLSKALATEAGYKNAKQLLQEFYEIGDISSQRQWTLDLSHTGIQLINMLDKSIKENLTRAEGEFSDFSNKLSEFFKIAKQKNKNISLFLQKDNGEWTGNLTNRYTQEWYRESGEMGRKFTESLNRAKTKEQISSIFKRRNKWLQENTVEIDIRYFVDGMKPSELMSKSQYLNWLNEQFGEIRAQELITQALEEYNEYLSELKNVTELVNNEVSLGIITKEGGETKLNEWKNKNNPEVWFNQKNVGNKVFLQNNKSRYVIRKPRRVDSKGNRTKWYDSNFEKIEADKELMDMYEFIRTNLTYQLGVIPAYLKRDDINAAFLPRIQKEMINSLLGTDLKGAASTISQDWIDGLTTQQGDFSKDIDPNTQKPYRNIPTNFLKNIPVEDRSDNLEKILLAFGKMSIMYKWRSKIEDKALLVNKFLSDVSNSDSRRQYTEDDLKKLKELLEFTIDANIYDKRKELEGVSNIKIIKDKSYLPIKDEFKDELDSEYSKLLSKGLSNEEALAEMKVKFPTKMEIVSGRTKYKYLQSKRDVIEDMFYNKEITEEEYNAKIKPLEEEAESMGKSLVWSKVGDKVLRFNQLLALGFNPFSAVNNYMFGVTSNIVWAAGNTDFTPKDMWKSFGLMWASVLNLKNKKLDKIANLMIKFNIMTEVVDIYSEGKNETLEKIKNSPFILLKNGDYFIKGNTFIAKMLNTKIKDLKGNERTLFEAFDNEAKWKTEEFGDNSGWNGNIANEEDMRDFLDFRASTLQLNKKLHGNFDFNSPVMYKKYILGRFIGQFRLSWMAEGFEQRFGMRRVDPYLNREVEGRYRTYYNLGFMKSIKTLTKLIMFNSNAFQGIKAKDRAIVEENMRRNMMEIYLYAVMLSIYLTLKYLASDDDDEDKNKIYTVLNMLNRVMSDTTFYFSPNTFISIIKDPIPALRVPINAGKAFKGAGNLIFESDLTDREIEAQWLKITNAFPVTNLYNKSKYMGERLLED